jgi:hypothetical protein
MNILEAIYQLSSKSNAEDFKYDPDIGQLAGYAAIVLVPMSLQRIAQRILRCYYRTMAAFVFDVLQLVTNCDSFNLAGSEITQAARGIAAVLLRSVGLDPSKFHQLGQDSLKAIGEFGLDGQVSEDSESEYDAGAAVDSVSVNDGGVQDTNEVQYYQGIVLSDLPARGSRREEFVGVISRIVGNASRLDPDGIFDEPVDESIYADYRAAVSNPICLHEVRQRIKAYNAVQEVAADLLRIYDNAMLYNPEENEVHQLALRIKLGLIHELQTAQLQLKTPLRADLPRLQEPASAATAMISGSPGKHLPSVSTSPRVITRSGAGWSSSESGESGVLSSSSSDADSDERWDGRPTALAHRRGGRHRPLSQPTHLPTSPHAREARRARAQPSYAE